MPNYFVTNVSLPSINDVVLDIEQLSANIYGKVASTQYRLWVAENCIRFTISSVHTVHILGSLLGLAQGMDECYQ